VAVTGGWDLAGEARELMVVMTQLNLSELTGWGGQGEYSQQVHSEAKAMGEQQH
jgi:hypothetical protein